MGRTIIETDIKEIAISSLLTMEMQQFRVRTE